MLTLEQKDPNDTVFPQDVQTDKELTPGGPPQMLRYGGLTKHEMFVAMFVAAAVQRTGLPPSAEAAQLVVEGALSLADGLTYLLKHREAPADPGMIIQPGRSGKAS